jgi:hypothetical protein
MAHGFAPFGSRGNGTGPIGERLLDRGVRPTPAQVSAELAALHTSEAAIAEVISFDFSQRDEEEDVDFAPTEQQVM